MKRSLLMVLFLGCLFPVWGWSHTDPAAGQALPQASPQATPQAADPDTVQAHLILPEAAILPVRVTLRPDTLLLGRDAFLELEYDLAALPAEPGSLVAGLEIEEPWFHWEGESSLSETQPQALVLPVKVYQINPFLVRLGELETPVYLVGLTTEGTQETASIRDPRRWGWNLFTLITGALIAAALILLAWWAWTARKVATEKLPQWDVPAPGWMSFCLDLEKLYGEDVLPRGDTAVYLDRLAGICRRYLATRFRVGALEMTGPEVESACSSLGHDVVATGPFVDILQAIDGHRFNPEPPSANTCRKQTGHLFQAVSRVRILPVYTPVDAGQLVAAEQSWGRLVGLESEWMATAVEEFSPDGAGGGL